MTSITIPIAEYKRLRTAELFLSALEDLGIEHWSFYDEAVQRCEELQIELDKELPGECHE